MSRPILPESAYEALGLSPATIHDLMNPKPVVKPPEIAAPNLLHSDEDHARPMLPNETSITLYAELLLHIRTVTLFASLRTNHSRETKARLSADGSCITVSHEGESASIRLPFNVKGGGDAALSLPSAPPTKELTLRLQLEEQDDSNVFSTLQSGDRQANLVPWDGASLSQLHDLVIVCKGCGEVMVPRGNITQWRDLPNENWAEMMDFWHCHKPDEHHLHDHTHEAATGQKGYAASNRLQAVEGVGHVDLTSFLLKEQDCEGAQLSSEDDSQAATIVCRHCDQVLGTRDEATDGWRIQKWPIGIRAASTFSAGLPTSYSAQKWISARLLYLIENTGIRKFHIHPPPISSSSFPVPASSTPSTPPPSKPIPSLLLWAFTPDLLFSSSIPSPNRHDPTRSMKVFYQNQTWQPLQPGDTESASIEDVEFSADLFEELDSALRLSQRVLPPTAKKWGEWTVGLLERFDSAEVGKSDAKKEDGETGGLEGLQSEDVH